MNRCTLYTLLLIIYTFASEISLADAVQINYERNIYEVEGGNKTHTKSNITLVLEKKRMLIIEPNVKIVLDAVQNNIIIVNEKNKYYTVTPLYAIPATLSAEMQNRELMQKLSDPKFEEKYRDIFDAEMQLGMRSRAPLLHKIQFKSDGNKVDVTYAGESVARIVFSNIDLPKEYKDIFNKYFLYFSYFHPDIRKEILNRDKFFQEFSYNLSLIGRKVSVSYVMLNVKSTDGISFNIPPGCKQKFSQDSRLNDIIVRLQDKSKMSTPADYETKITELLSQSRFIEALLFIDANLLQYGIISNQIKNPRLKEAINNPNKDMRAVLGVLYGTPKSVEEVDTLLNSVQGVLDKKLEGYEMLYVSFSNHYTEANHGVKGRDFMYKALEINPFIASALIDLGKFYTSSYDFDSTAECCKQAMNISKNTPLADFCVLLESRIKAEFPDYF